MPEAREGRGRSAEQDKSMAGFTNILEVAIVLARRGRGAGGDLPNRGGMSVSRERRDL
jgi:hypothetical protein